MGLAHKSWWGQINTKVSGFWSPTCRFGPACAASIADFVQPLSATILCVHVCEIWSGSNNHVYIHWLVTPPPKKKKKKLQKTPIIKPTYDQKQETFVAL